MAGQLTEFTANEWYVNLPLSYLNVMLIPLPDHLGSVFTATILTSPRYVGIAKP